MEAIWYECKLLYHLLLFLLFSVIIAANKKYAVDADNAQFVKYLKWKYLLRKMQKEI